MILLRSLVFYIMFSVWTIFCFTVESSTIILGVGNKYALLCCRMWAYVAIKFLKITCNISYKLEGIENIPDHPFAVASKHQSAFETIFFHITFKNTPAFILKKELTYIPFFGWGILASGMIAIDRSNGISALRQLKAGVQKAMDQGRPIVIFPEGTRTKPGERVPYKPGIKFIYDSFKDKLKIVPVALDSGKYWPKNSFLKYPGEIKVRILPPLEGVKSSELLTTLQEIIDGESERL